MSQAEPPGDDAGAEEGAPGAQADEDTRATFSELPPEIKLMVFRRVGQEEKLRVTPLVCWEWYRLSRDPGAWTSLSLSGRRADHEKAVELVRRMPMLRRLVVKRCKTDPDVLLEAVAMGCPDLAFLEVRGVATQRKETMGLVAQKCSNLKDVVVMDCSQPEGSKDPIEAFSVCQKLSIIFFSANSTLNPAAIPAIAGYANLRDVFINKTPCDADLQVLVQLVGRQLRTLRVAQLHQDRSFQLLQDCPNLEDLGLVGSPVMSDQSLLEGVGSLAHLRHLTLNFMPKLTSSALVTFFYTRTKAVGLLESLDLRYLGAVDDLVAQSIASHCPLLRYLNLSRTRISLDSLVLLVRCCGQLRDLQISGLGLTSMEIARLFRLHADLEITWREW